MLRKDYIQREIDKLALVFAAILEKLLGMKSLVKPADMLEYAHTTFKAETNIDFQHLGKVPHEHFLHALLKTEGINNYHLSGLADVYAQLADSFAADSDTEKARDLYTRALIIFEHLAFTKNYPNRLMEIANKLNNL